VQYIQNTINKVETEKIENNHEGIDAERRWKTIIDMPKSVCMCGHHIWKARTYLIHRPSGSEVILINVC
jgi:hypothetical protein